MQDWQRHRVQLAGKRLLRETLWRILVVRARLTAAPRPAPRPAPGGGSVLFIDRCLGIGDVLMMSPALTLLEPLGPVAVVAAAPPLLTWGGEWHRCGDWEAQWQTLAALTAAGRLVVAPRLGLGGLGRLLLQPALPPGIFGLDGRRWLNTVSGATGIISGRHYTDGAVAVAREALRQGGASGSSGGEDSIPSRLPPRVAPRETLTGAGLPPGPWVAFAPWATSRIRRWPLAHWRVLAARLRTARPDTAILLLGADEEREHGDVIAAGLAGVHNFMGRLSLAETARVIQDSAALVACDNGLMHLGLGCGVPVLALFGSTDPATRLLQGVSDPAPLAWALWEASLCPFGRAPCYPDLMRDPACPGGVECLAGLSPERAAVAVLGWLGQPEIRVEGAGRTPRDIC